jgi:hypothetical protein
LYFSKDTFAGRPAAASANVTYSASTTVATAAVTTITNQKIGLTAPNQQPNSTVTTATGNNAYDANNYVIGSSGNDVNRWAIYQKGLASNATATVGTVSTQISNPYYNEGFHDRIRFLLPYWLPSTAQNSLTVGGSSCGCYAFTATIPFKLIMDFFDKIPMPVRGFKFESFQVTLTGAPGIAYSQPILSYKTANDGTAVQGLVKYVCDDVDLAQLTINNGGTTTNGIAYVNDPVVVQGGTGTSAIAMTLAVNAGNTAISTYPNLTGVVEYGETRIYVPKVEFKGDILAKVNALYSSNQELEIDFYNHQPFFYPQNSVTAGNNITNWQLSSNITRPCRIWLLPLPQGSLGSQYSASPCCASQLTGIDFRLNGYSFLPYLVNTNEEAFSLLKEEMYAAGSDYRTSSLITYSDFANGLYSWYVCNTTKRDHITPDPNASIQITINANRTEINQQTIDVVCIVEYLERVRYKLATLELEKY